MLPATEGSYDHNHVVTRQRTTLDTGQHLALNPSIKGTEQDGEHG
ncbi:hypothetical protein [Tsuneonella suprasediminis]